MKEVGHDAAAASLPVFTRLHMQPELISYVTQ